MKPPHEKSKLVTLSVRVDEQVAKKFDAVCASRYRSMAQELRRFVEDQVAQASDLEEAA